MVKEFRYLGYVYLCGGQCQFSGTDPMPLKITATGKILLDKKFHLVPPSQKMSSTAESLQMQMESTKFTPGTEEGKK